MPRFQAKPITVEAHQYQGNTLNMDGAFNAAFVSFQAGGAATVRVGNLLCPVQIGDWLVRGPDGVVRPVSAAAFEDSFAPAPITLTLNPAALPAANGRKQPHVR